MKEFVKKRPLCTLVYEHNEWGTGLEAVSETVLKRCIPNDGVFLFEISATYSKQMSPSTYYYLGTSGKHVKERFLNVMGGWMNIVGIRLIPPGDEAERIFTNPNTMPI